MVVIVIPTYNEAENISKLISSLFALGLDIFVIVVDDNSPDGTGDIVEGLSKSIYNNLSLIRRKTKSGRGGACLCGFNEALNMDCRYIVEMDADLSHAPEELPLLIKACEKADMAIGSRYLPQSKIVGWRWQRRVFSKLANYYARIILKIPIKDYTNGYRCYRESALEKIDLSKIKNTGYITLSELGYCLYKTGCRFVEVPTIFINRRRGKSNVTVKEIVSAFLGIIKIRINFKR